MLHHITQRQVENAIQSLVPFSISTGNMTGYKADYGTRTEYSIYSYGVLIARLEFTLKGIQWVTTNKWITDKKYSVTTSRHTNLARRALKRF